MKNMRLALPTRCLLAGVGLFVTGYAAAAPSLSLVDGIEVALDSGEIHEIVSVEASTGTLFATFETGLRSYSFDGNSLSAGSTLDLTNAFTFDNIADSINSVSSVAIDPLGRGFGAAVVIPNQSHINFGKVVLFDTATNAVVRTFDAGYHPDMVTFSADGSKLVIANEGEPVIINTNTGLRAKASDNLTAGELALADKAGSLSLMDVSAINTTNLGSIALSISDFDFSAPNLGAGVAPKLDALRVREANEGNELIDVEPEYVTVQGNQAFVTMQENNAVAVFDFTTTKWVDIQDLGAIEQDKVDVSNDDGGIFLDDFVKGLPMPDAIASYSTGGMTYYVTANEGDGRDYIYDEDGADITIFSDEERIDGETAPGATFGFSNPANEPSLADRNDDAKYGRLKVINDHLTDPDGVGGIDNLQAFGSRSFTIWDADGNIVFDSGELDATDLSQITNNAGTYADGRSDDKGPEPESIEIGTIDGKTFAFVGLERTGGIAMFDITDPNSVTFLDYVTETGVSPEGLDFFEFDGNAYLAVAYEGSEDPGQADIEVYQIVPEPSSLALLAMGGLLITRRRRG
ncbi:MAG: choice-of-anchor I family protein [Phycisphaeraceae bacterium]|nr:choice-of-anchor I family protein [Phycisphaeraceae bacterium]